MHYAYYREVFLVPFSDNGRKKVARGIMDLLFKIHVHGNEISVQLVLLPEGWKSQ